VSKMSNELSVFDEEDDIRSHRYVDPRNNGRRTILCTKKEAKSVVLCTKKEAKSVAYESL
jgi:hypothetical protein